LPVIAVSFLPVLPLEAQAGRLFKPLACTKNLSMTVAALLATTLDPALRLEIVVYPAIYQAWKGNGELNRGVPPEARPI
jgi:Cu/Ag efflux pump CusA